MSTFTMPITTTSGTTKTPSDTSFGITPSFFSLTAQTARSGASPPVGSISAEWKRVHSEDESPKVSLETILQALCTPKRLLDVVENFILFMEAQGGLIKILAKNHQYLGVNNTIANP